MVTVRGNDAPRSVARMCQEASGGDQDRAKEIDNSLQPLNEALFVESNPIPVKWALQQMGLISGGIRLPLTRFSEEYHAQMQAALKTAGIDLPGDV